MVLTLGMKWLMLRPLWHPPATERLPGMPNIKYPWIMTLVDTPSHDSEDACHISGRLNVEKLFFLLPVVLFEWPEGQVQPVLSRTIPALLAS